MTHSPATKIPGVFYNGHDLSRAQMSVIWSVGKTPREAVRSLARARRWGRTSGFQILEGGVSYYTWGLRFIANDGTGFKAAGIHVPGGVVCTWWK